MAGEIEIVETSSSLIRSIRHLLVTPTACLLPCSCPLKRRTCVRLVDSSCKQACISDLQVKDRVSDRKRGGMQARRGTEQLVTDKGLAEG
jgi:hypothetical protein